MKQYIYMYVYT